MILFKTGLCGWIFEKKLQTGLLKMHIHSLPVGGAFGKSEI